MNTKIKIIGGLNMKDLTKVILAHVNGNVPAEYAEVSKKDREEAIRKAFLKQLGLETYSAKEFRKAFRRHEVAVFELIETLISDSIKGVEGNAFLQQFCETKNIDLGDANSFWIEGANNLIVSEFSGNHYNIKRQRVEEGSEFIVSTRDYGISVYAYIEQVASGKIDWAKLISLVSEAVELKIQEVAHTTLKASLDAIPSSFVFNGSYNEEGIMAVASKVESVNGEAPILVGTRAALAKLQNKTVVGLSDAQRDEKARKGYNTYWNGYECVELQNFVKRGTYDEVLSNDTIFVMGAQDRCVKVVLEGGEIVRELTGTEKADRSQEMTLQFKMGVAVVHSDVLGRITLA